MKMKLFIASLALGALMTDQLHAQTTKWYFGSKAGLTFNADGTTTANSNNTAMNTNEGCTAVTDVSGNLLFFADGEHLWNGAGTEITNASTQYLLGGASSTQAALAVPIPDASCSKFLVFTTPGVEIAASFPNGLGASLINVNGATVTKSTSNQVVPGTTFSEKLACTQDNTNGYWVVAHNFAKSTSTSATTFYAYHITNALASASITTTTQALAALTLTTSSVGTSHNLISGSDPGYNAQGQMKFSPDGTKLALTLAGSKIVEIFNFNKVTGTITLLQTLNLATATPAATSNVYGLEFSPNGRILYASESFGNSGLFKNIYQIDLTTFSISTIIAAKISGSNYTHNAMQLGPNGKIYIAGPGINLSALSVINNPDVLGAGCNYSSGSVSIGIAAGGLGTTYGLPTVISLSRSCNDQTKPCQCSGVSVIGTVNTQYEDINNGVYAVKYRISSGGKNIKMLRVTLVNWEFAGASACTRISEANSANGKILSATGTGINNSNFRSYPETTDGSIPYSPYSVVNGPSHSYIFSAVAAPAPIQTDAFTDLVLLYKFNGQTGSGCLRNIKFSVRFEFLDANCNLCQVYSFYDPTAAVPVYGITNEEISATEEEVVVGKAEKLLQVYPNPTDGSFMIKTNGKGTATYELYNATGALHKKGVIEGNKELKENLKAGVYLIKVAQDGIESTEKIIVK